MKVKLSFCFFCFSYLRNCHLWLSFNQKYRTCRDGRYCAQESHQQQAQAQTICTWMVCWKQRSLHLQFSENYLYKCTSTIVKKPRHAQHIKNGKITTEQYTCRFKSRIIKPRQIVFAKYANIDEYNTCESVSLVIYHMSSTRMKRRQQNKMHGTISNFSKFWKNLKYFQYKILF